MWGLSRPPLHPENFTKYGGPHEKWGGPAYSGLHVIRTLPFPKWSSLRRYFNISMCYCITRSAVVCQAVPPSASMPPFWHSNPRTAYESISRWQSSANASFHSFTLTSANLPSNGRRAARWRLWRYSLPPPLSSTVRHPCTESRSLSRVRSVSGGGYGRVMTLFARRLVQRYIYC